MPLQPGIDMILDIRLVVVLPLADVDEFHQSLVRLLRAKAVHVQDLRPLRIMIVLVSKYKVLVVILVGQKRT